MRLTRKVTSQVLLSALLLSNFATMNQPATASQPQRQQTLPTTNLISKPQQTMAAPAAPTATLLNTYTLTDTALGAFQNLYLTGTITNDRQIDLGGIGSDLWHSPGDPADEFWMVTDRGPITTVSGTLAFAVPAFDPVILHVRVTLTNTIDVLNALPILTSSGAPVTGLPNNNVYDEKPFQIDGTTVISYNPDGLDTEGLVRTTAGDFWVAEEYNPSLVHLDSTGKTIRRYAPQGLVFTPTQPTSPMTYNLPGILTRRKGDRGFEGLTLSNDQKQLFVAVFRVGTLPVP